MKKSLLFALTIFLVTGCTGSKKLKTFSKSDLIFGSNGGFTGSKNEYTLHYDGAIEKSNSLTNETVELTTVSKKKTKSLFRLFIKSGLDTLNFSVPGNMSQFVGFRNDTVTRKIIWGDNTTPPVDAKIMYNELIRLIKKQ